MSNARDGILRSSALMEKFLALHPRKIDLSLGRIEALLAKLGDPHKKLPPVIHVTGTNGKGSTTAFMRAMLEVAGQRVHVYTSPHLVRFHERIRLAGTLVNEEELTQAFEACEAANAGAPVTVFEMTTAAAFYLFSRTPADVLMLEVGLGGRYDATNVIAKPLASVITPVSHDHAEFLGTDLAGIAREKAGIIKRGAPVVSGWQSAIAFHEIEREAQKLSAPLLTGGQDFNCYEQHGRFVYEDGEGLLDLPRPKLAGQHQFENAATAIATLRRVFPGLSENAFAQGVTQADWPARMQNLTGGALAALLPEGAELWLDGAHNEAGGQVLAATLIDLNDARQRPLVIICGSLASKDTGAFLRNFARDEAGASVELIAVPIPGEHAARSASEIAALARNGGLEAREAAGFEAALRAISARRWAIAPRVLIAGSLYLAGEVLRANGTLPE